MYGIVRDIPKPPDLKAKQAGSKYPLAEMEVGDSFIVPYGDMQEGETPEKFRNRVYKSCRNYALRDGKGKPDGERKDFSATVMDKDDDQDPKRWVTGDVVVWRDK